MSELKNLRWLKLDQCCKMSTCHSKQEKLFSALFVIDWSKFKIIFLCRLFYPEENFKSDLERQREFGAIFTHTLYYLAQVNAAMGHSKKGAMYCHTTLRRQLETDQYDPVDWALNCATLSQYYITQPNYILSRHCLGMYI